MKWYTCGFMFDHDMNVILVRKKKPKWQAGLLNGVGGITNRGETQLNCMIREFKEETGIETWASSWKHVCFLRFGRIDHPDSVRIDFFAGAMESFGDLPMFNDSGEDLVIAKALDLPEDVIPNLRWLIPLALDKDGCGKVGGFDVQ